MMHPRTLPASSLLFLALAAGPAQARVIVTGLDTVTTPGQPVALRAKFEHGFSIFRPDYKDRAVHFTQVGTGRQLAGRTDRDGVAEVQVQASVPGVYRFQAELDAKPGVTAESRVWVLDPAKPVVVIDIDGTLSNMPSFLTLFRGAKAPSYPGAPELVRDLAARGDQILYLTARDDFHDKATREFLKRHNFPDGPILYNDQGLTSIKELKQFIPKNHGEFKLGVLRDLKAHGVDLVLGIGNAETDAYAYENAGLPSMIHTKKQASGPSFRFEDYAAQLRPHLVQLGFLPSGQGITQAVPTP